MPFIFKKYGIVIDILTLTSPQTGEFRYMRKLFRLFFIFTCLYPGLSTHLANAQTTFASEDELKKQAALLFENDQFEEAYPLYSQLVSLYQKDVNYNYRLGVCMLYASDDKEKPIAFLEFASNKPEVEKEVLFYLARAYHLNYRFDDAIKKYNEYKKVASASKAEKLMVDRQIEMCKNGKKLLRNITDLLVLDKKEMSRADFYRAYDISEIGGKLLAKPDEAAFKSAIDKKKKENSIIYLSNNNNQIFFSSYGDNPERGKDIYTIKKLPNGEWSKPQTLGYPVNTEYDEDYPFLHPNGKVLYFCSKGHNSMGGYDIFKTTLNEETNTWNKPVNMDFPINTPDDDILYVTNENEQEAFFSSARNSVTGKTAVFHINVERKPIDVAIIKGAVVPNRDGQALDIRITVKDLGDNSMLGIYNAKENGSYIINLPNGGKFLYTVEANGFKTQSEVVVLPVQYEFKPLKQEISYELGTDKLIIKNLFDEPIDDANYLLAMKYLKEKSKMEVSSAQEIAAMNNKPSTNETASKTNENKSENQKDNNQNQPVNISNNDIVKIAYNDAKETETEAKELTEQANIALSIANQKSLLAQNKQNEANQLLADANKMNDPNKKKQALSEANDVATEAEQLNQETVAAFNLAKRLEQNAAAKQKEADLSLKYAESIENAVKSKNPTDALKKADELQKQLDALNQENANQGNIVNSLKIDVSNKKAELDKATQASDDIRQSIADNNTLIKNLQNDIEKTKNEKIKADLQNQIEGLKADNEENEKDLTFNEQRVAKLQKEYETVKNEMDLVSNVVNQSKTTSNETAAASVANIDKNKLEQQVETIKNNNNVTATNKNQPNTNEKNTTIALNQTNQNNNNQQKNNPTTNTTDNEIKNTTSEVKTDYNLTYSNELEKIEFISNPLEKEKKKQEIYTNWNSDINKDIADKKQEAKNTKDSKRKKELNNEIALLEKSLKENQKNTTEINARVNQLEKESAIVSNTNNETENNTSTNTNQKYAEKLFESQNIKDESEREQTKANVLNEWANAIDKDIENKRKEMAASNDPEMKALLASKIIDLKKQSEEKHTQANEAQNNADKLKQNQPLANGNESNSNTTENTTNKTTNKQNTENETANKETNNNSNSLATQNSSNQSITTTNENKNSLTEETNKQSKTENNATTNNTAVTNTSNNNDVITNNNSEGNFNYTEKLSATLVTANAKSNELEKEKLKQQAYTEFITAASNDVTEKKQELNTTKDKKRKKELTQEINTLEKEIIAKQSDLAATESVIERIEEESLVNKQNNLTTESGKNNTNADNYKYTSNQSKTAAEKADLLANESEALFNKSKELENKSASTTNKNEKNKLSEEAQNIAKQAETKRIESLTNYSEANTIEIKNNTQLLEQYASSSKNKNNDDVLMAEMIKDEAIAYSEKAKKSRMAAENESSYFAKETLLNDANENEKIALNKQTKALEIYKKNNPNFVANTTLTNNTSNSNINNNSENKNITTQKTENLAINTTENKNSQIINNQTDNKTTSTSSSENKQSLENSVTNNSVENTNTQTNNANNLASNNKQASTPIENNGNTTSNNQTVVANNTTKSAIVLSPDEKFTRTTQPVYTSNKPIPVNEKLPEGLIFKVQIGAFRNPIPPETFKGISPITAETTESGLTRYTAGIFKKFSTADQVKEEIRGLGYKDAFVVAFLNGKRIPINQAMEMLGLPPVATTSGTTNNTSNNVPTTNNNIVASQNTPNNSSSQTTVTNNSGNSNITSAQAVNTVGGLFYTVQIGVFSQQVSSEKLFGIQPLYTEVAPNGYIRYNTGIYNNIPRATEAKNIVVNAGIKDAFIVAYFNGKRISPAEAQQLIAENKANYSTAANMNMLPTIGNRNSSNSNTVNTTNNTANTNTNTNSNFNSTASQITNTANTASNTTTNNTTNNTTNTNTSNTANTSSQPNPMPIEDGVVFKVQIGAFREEVPLEIANKFLKIAKKGIKNYKDDNGLTIYSVGSYKSYDEALTIKNEVIAEADIKDAFIVAYNNGKKISVEEAKQLTEK